MNLDEILAHCKVPPDKAPYLLIMVETGRHLEAKVKLRAHALADQAALATSRTQRDLHLKAAELHNMAKYLRYAIIEKVEDIVAEIRSTDGGRVDSPQDSPQGSPG